MQTATKLFDPATISLEPLDECQCSPAAKAVLGAACCSSAKPANPYDAVLARIDAELAKLATGSR